MSKGFKSSEFIGIILFIGFLIISGFAPSVLPTKSSRIQMGIVATQDALPAILNTIQSLIDQFGDQTLLGGLLWAYIKKRTNLKDKDLELKKLQVQEAIEKYRAICLLKKTGVKA